jgi:phosphatidylserine/phosphatidylglycerophosphate/cardiolipin synthase-like enzyme
MADRSPLDSLHPERSVRASLVAGRGHYESVVRAVLGAETSVWIATANLKDLWVQTGGEWQARGGRRRAYRSVLESFDGLASRRVELRILHARLPSVAFRAAFDRHPRLVAGGLELRLCPRVHFKAVIVDGALLYLGSANWTGAGLGAKSETRRNFELGFVTEEPRLLDLVQGLYDRIWRGMECRRCRRRNVCEAPLDQG